MRIGDKVILLRKVLGFTAVSREGTVSAAADKNGMKQSNLSAYVADLEAKVNAKLFERGDRRMILTETGKNIYEIGCSIEKSPFYKNR